jgi:hypothetical protein
VLIAQLRDSHLLLSAGNSLMATNARNVVKDSPRKRVTKLRRRMIRRMVRRMIRKMIRKMTKRKQLLLLLNRRQVQAKSSQ